MQSGWPTSSQDSSGTRRIIRKFSNGTNQVVLADNTARLLTIKLSLKGQVLSRKLNSMSK